MTTATYTGKGEFYSGIKAGERVRVETVKIGPFTSYRIQSIETPGPWLRLYDLDRLALDAS